MQTPTMKTPVSKCVDLSAYTAQMCSKFPTNKNLAAIAAKVTAAASALDDAQTTYTAAVKAILPTRVDVKYENFTSDRRVRLCQQRAEIADGKKNGLIEATAFPDGSATITRLLGQSQVDEMIALEGRLAALLPAWPGADTEAQEIAQCRKSYKAALDGRTKAGQSAAAVRAVRDVAKQGWLTTYIESQHLVEAEYPRDTTMQELFFDDVRAPSSAAQADTSDPPPPDPGTPATPATPAATP